MVLLASTVSHPPSLPIEQRIAPELSWIYHSSSLDSESEPRSFKQPAIPALDRPASQTPDPTLASLAQLGLYRSGGKRAFVTLLDDREFRIIADTTIPTAHSSKESPNTATTESLRGVKSLYLHLNKRKSTESSDNTAPDNVCIARDVRLIDSLKGHPLVARCPYIRFYVEIALRSSSGEIIGTYGVMDRYPRTSFGAVELTDLRDTAGTISRYLENVWKAQHIRRSERQLNALLTFVKGTSPPLATEPESLQEDTAPNQLSPRSSVVPALNRLSVSNPRKPSVSSPPANLQFCENTGPSPFFESHEPQTVPLSPRDTHQQHVRKCSDTPNNLVLVTDTASISSRTSWLFARASSLLQQCMDLDGVLFLDASRSNSRRSSYGGSSDGETSPKAAESSNSPHSADTAHQAWSEKLCEPLGAAVPETSRRNSRRPSSQMLTEGLLHDMFAAYPQGEVFHPLGANNSNPNLPHGPSHSHHQTEKDRETYQALSARLAHSFPDAKSIVFVPLWNWDKSRWLAGTLIWTCQDQRMFGEDDLSYLRAFGDSIVSEFSHLDWTATEKSKSDLLSSVSHELRSPLHGMLASTELLQSTSLEPTQRDMVSMVETCGLTLLDTMNYLLDFTKINNLTRVHKKTTHSEADVDDLTAEFDLDDLVEDVTDALYSGHRSAISASKIAGRYLPVGIEVTTNRNDTKQPSSLGDLSVVVRIEEQDSWRIQSLSGGWRRIIMNLLGNAFKFTQGGFIEVSLAKIVERGRGANAVYAHLTITDTGCGISPEFLEHKLYTPFTQESILTEGVGLGLSIAQRLVTHLGGYMEIKSELGGGTQVDVHIPTEFVEKEPSLSIPGSRIVARVCLVGMNAYLSLKEAPQTRLTADAKRKIAIRSAVSSILLSQPGWTVSGADSMDEAVGDIVVVEESTLKKIAERGPIKTKFKSIIVLGEHGISIPEDFGIEGADVIYIPQPLGPRKIIQALQRFTESHPETSPEEENPIFGPISGMPTRGRSLSEAFAMAKGIESPPVVKENISEFSPPLSKGTDQQDLHVLIVDDNDINLNILSTFMRKIGCSYETASNGLVALEKYKGSARKFDYVLMDISMPVMDGIVASGRIREYEEHHSLPRTTIMAVTGVASSEMQQQAFAAGIDDYLVKPLALHDLKRIMSIT